MKKIYNQPATQVAYITLQANLLAVSPIDGSNKVNPIYTDDQW